MNINKYLKYKSKYLNLKGGADIYPQYRIKIRDLYPLYIRYFQKLQLKCYDEMLTLFNDVEQMKSLQIINDDNTINIHLQVRLQVQIPNYI